ncbi:BRI3-binding protein isoform X2 [Grammomys surdaster]|uniref:BRI3-binding protein isoform X2 n=1 Tax=Grammomys surdaster TaxID=491861 RepID=UPI00109FBD34|nr:BRI3-binding protein isoform X2 [Grammomys surdaster]
MGARASQEPRARARVGLRVLLPVLLLALLLVALVAPGAQGARGRGAADKNSHRRATSSFSQSLSSLFGEDNVRAAQKLLSRLTERFVQGVDMFLETLWKVWMELLEVLGLDDNGGGACSDDALGHLDLPPLLPEVRRGQKRLLRALTQYPTCHSTSAQPPCPTVPPGPWCWSVWFSWPTGSCL